MESVKAGALLAVGVAAITLVGCTGSGKSPSHASGLTQGAVAPALAANNRSLSLGSGESFAPADHARARLSATQAWVTYATKARARTNRKHIPMGTTARIGVFVDGGGRRHLAYAYFTPNTAPASSGLVTSTTPERCTEWMILNANTGSQIETSWFRCAPLPSSAEVFVITAKPLGHQQIASCVNRGEVAQSVVATSAPGSLSVTLRQGAGRSTANVIAACLRALQGPRLLVSIVRAQATPE
jgi:hypothetical protein